MHESECGEREQVRQRERGEREQGREGENIHTRCLGFSPLPGSTTLSSLGPPYPYPNLEEERGQGDARSEYSVLCPLHQEEDTHAQEHALADACARARLPPLRASMRAGSTLCSMPVAICAYARFVATMPTALASAQGAGKEGRDLAPRGEQAARDGGGGRGPSVVALG